MSNHVLVLDTNYKPLTPCKSSTARRLLNVGKAAVFRRHPFTIILKKEVNEVGQPCQIKIDSGSKTTGIALLKGNQLVWGAELTHRGQQIKNALESRRSIRRNRRNRKTRYRQPRFLNRTRATGWLAPSLEHRVLTTMTWVKRIMRFCAVDAVAQELVRFDTQKMQNFEISGKEYQQGTLYQYETREYLLEKFNRTCVYCGAKNVPLEVEHIRPKSKGGSNRISNLTITCVPCNQAKSNLSIEEFLSDKPSLKERILRKVKAPLKDAAAVNSTRWALWRSLNALGIKLTTGTGGQTKYNRCRLGLPKTHWLDAACVGVVEALEVLTNQPLLIKATGHGKRQMCGTDKYGFPKRHCSNKVVHFGFKTGDIVRADVPKGKNQGVHVGRVTIRAKGSFNLKTATGMVQGVNQKYCNIIHKKDGYSYAF
ncbi:MAG: HNH endonuclease [Cyanobacteria bacterium J083]|nr:MAG: HNH endonuclease [Cyanobacteria bacterium J083]